LIHGLDAKCSPKSPSHLEPCPRNSRCERRQTYTMSVFFPFGDLVTRKWYSPPRCQSSFDDCVSVCSSWFPKLTFQCACSSFQNLQFTLSQHRSLRRAVLLFPVRDQVEPSGAQGYPRERGIPYLSAVPVLPFPFGLISHGLEFFKRGSVERLPVRLLTWDLRSPFASDTFTNWSFRPKRS
jgi:hypothetical protein